MELPAEGWVGRLPAEPLASVGAVGSALWLSLLRFAC